MRNWMLDVPVVPQASYGGAWLPEDMGFRAIACDPGTTIAGLALAAGQINFFRIRLLRPAAITGVVVPVQVAGATLTSGQNLAGLYSTAGTRLAETASQDVSWTSTGWRQAAFTASVNLAAGDYFVALLFNGTTSPQFSRQNNVITGNGVLTTPLASLRSIRTTGGGRTSLAASINFASEAEIAGGIVPVALY